MKQPQIKVSSVMSDFIQNAAGLAEERRSHILGMLRARDFRGLAAVGDSVGVSVVDPNEARTLLQVSAFVKKNASLEESGCRDAALGSFLECERRCRITNKRLEYYYLHPERLSPELSVFVSRCQQIIADVLGSHSAFLDELPSRLRVTDGASATAPRRSSFPVLKLTKRIVAPARALPYLESLRTFFGYDKVPQFIPYEMNRVEFVPKNFKTYRTIAAEPAGVLPLQLAVDSWLKDRLRRFGVDLSSQVLNQELSRQSSIDGRLATLDLKSASDNVSLNLVHYLFPEKWRHLLCDFRSPSGNYVDSDGVKKRLFYAKFASMGNGMTFAIETLVYLSVLRAVCGRTAEIAVYGDDLICPVEFVPSVRRLLRFFGFPLNEEKSFWAGNFRESCGKHWFNGVDVTPFFVRKEPRTRGDICHFINGIVPLFPSAHTLSLFKRRIAELGLPFVPFNCDSRSGIFISPTEAYKRKLIRFRKKWPFIPSFRGIITVEKDCLTTNDSRGYFLWFLKKSARHSDLPDPILDKYRLRPGLVSELGRWIGYNPVGHTPLHLYWWDSESRE